MLIDTHVLLWLLDGDKKKIGPNSRKLLANSFNGDLVSIASFFEIKLKQRTSKLQAFPLSMVEEYLRTRGTTVLAITPHHLESIPGREVLAHSDPFDALLVSQAICEKTPLLTCDEVLIGSHVPGLRIIDGRK